MVGRGVRRVAAVTSVRSDLVEDTHSYVRMIAHGRDEIERLV